MVPSSLTEACRCTCVLRSLHSRSAFFAFANASEEVRSISDYGDLEGDGDDGDGDDGGDDGGDGGGVDSCDSDNGCDDDGGDGDGDDDDDCDGDDDDDDEEGDDEEEEEQACHLWRCSFFTSFGVLMELT